MTTFLLQTSVLLGLSTYPIYEGDRFSTGFFEAMVLVLLFAGPFSVVLALRDITKLLAAILTTLDEMKGGDDESLWGIGIVGLKSR